MTTSVAEKTNSIPFANIWQVEPKDLAQKTKKETKINAVQGIAQAEFILALNGPNGAGSSGEQPDWVLPGPVQHAWYQLVDNLGDMVVFNNITIVPGPEVGRPANAVSIRYHDNPEHRRAALLRIRVFAIYG